MYKKASGYWGGQGDLQVLSGEANQLYIACIGYAVNLQDTTSCASMVWCWLGKCNNYDSSFSRPAKHRWTFVGPVNIGERGSAPKRGRHSTIFVPPNASVQWQPDGLTIHTNKWFLGAGFLGAPPISLRIEELVVLSSSLHLGTRGGGKVC